jgi:hypothetical protein
MKILLLNIRWLGGQTKNLALKRLVEVDRQNIVLIQETMRKGDFLVTQLRTVLGNWDFLADDLDGLPRGLIIRWNHNITLMNSYAFSLDLCA